MKRIILVSFLVLSACLTTGAVQVFDLQTEIDNAPNGGTVNIPCGYWNIGDVVIASNDVWQKVVTIQGCGHGHLGQAGNLGGIQWGDAWLTKYGTYGTLLRGTISVKKGTGTTAKAYLRDFSLACNGAGVGIDYGDGVKMYPEGGIDGVSVGNCDTGIRLRMSYYMTINDVSIAGVGIGLDISQSNAITVTGLNVTTCEIGVRNTGNGNSFIGGSAQTCDIGFNLGGSSSVLYGYYFEDNGTSLVVSGNTNQIGANFYASNGGDILISGVGNDIFAADTNGPITITGWRNAVSLSRGACVNDEWPTLNKCAIISE